jgi:hypothetical protein
MHFDLQKIRHNYQQVLTSKVKVFEMKESSTMRTVQTAPSVKVIAIFAPNSRLLWPATTSDLETKFHQVKLPDEMRSHT